MNIHKICTSNYQTPMQFSYFFRLSKIYGSTKQYILYMDVYLESKNVLVEFMNINCNSNPVEKQLASDNISY